MRPDRLPLFIRRNAGGLLFSLLLFGAGFAERVRAAEIEVFEVPGKTLQGNPLGDRPERRVAAFVPDGTKAEVPLPLVIYLPGWGGSSEDFIAQGKDSWLSHVVDQLAADHHPLRIAVVDGRSRYGGSQFLDSTATGNYANYVADEIQPVLEARYGVTTERPARLIAGHSSGGYGALILTMNRHEKFDAVVALSPDSNFEVTHRPLVDQPAVQAVTRVELDAAMAPSASAQLPVNGLVRLIMGLCANYTPIVSQPGRFEWLYDDAGHWRPEVWQRWIAFDPLTLVTNRPDAFAPVQRVYLDGAEHDEFGANIGARKIYEVLKTRSSPVTFYEPPGHHGDHLDRRLIRGLEWVFAQGVPGQK